MATSVVYTVINGEIVEENRGGVVRDYVPDPLGSTVALTDATQTITDTFTYFPYGEVNTRTGTTATPFQFVGTQGYYFDSITRLYAAQGTLRANYGRWQALDGSYVRSANNPQSGAVPLSGRRKPPPYRYDPGKWNNGDVQTRNNCYCYALNDPNGPIFRMPGDSSGNRYNNCPGGTTSCNNLMANALRDGLTKPNPGCPSGSHRVAIFANPSGCGFHVYRQDPGGGWSNKDGPYPVTNCYSKNGGDFDGIVISNNPIKDPSVDAPDHGTPVKCGELCAPNDPRHLHPRP